MQETQLNISLVSDRMRDGWFTRGVVQWSPADQFGDCVVCACGDREQ